MIKVNKIKCKICGDVIESTSVHDFRECSCGACYVDGGRQYLRRGWDPKFGDAHDVFEELSVCTQDNEESETT